METVVRKYGGTSLAGLDQVRSIARSVAAARRRVAVVLVVSAQGSTTDELLGTAATLNVRRPTRESDQLLATGECASAALMSMALQEVGVPAVSLTGAQAGVAVVGPHGEGRVAKVTPTRIRSSLDVGEVPVVAGFQGDNPAGDVTTLGRGGSDTTAVALAAALGARRCEIYTDVDGVCSADPRIVPTASLLSEVDVNVMSEMAFAGAKVLHARAVELATAEGVEVHVRNSVGDRPGTVVRHGDDPDVLEAFGVLAVAHDLDVTRVLVRSGPGHRDPAVDVLVLLGEHNAPVDLVARSGPFEDEFRMGFTMRRSDLVRLADELRDLVAQTGGSVVYDEHVGKVSLIGTGMLNRPGHTARMLSVLADAGIATSWVSTSQLRTSVTIPIDRVHTAVALLHAEFELDRG